MTKAELRKQMKETLAGLDPVGKAFESMGKCVGFIQGSTFRDAGLVIGFMPMKDEVDILPILRTAIDQGKKVLLPRMIEGTNRMDFYRITGEPNQQTEPNSWGVYEPRDDLEKVSIAQMVSYSSEEKRDGSIVVLVPGLAFDAQGNRLGRGKGFYDVFLGELRKNAVFKPVFCGACYNAQVVGHVPCDEDDVRVDMIL